MTLYERFLDWYPLALVIFAIWPLIAYARAARLAPLASLDLGMVAGMAAFLALVLALVAFGGRVGSGGSLAVVWIGLALSQIFTIAFRRRKGDLKQMVIPLDQHVAAIAFASRQEISDYGPSRALRLRAAGILAAVALLASAIYALGWQLQPCAELDRALAVSGCMRELRLPQRRMSILAASPDGGTLALGGRDSSALYLIDPQIAQVQATLALTGEVTAIAWSPDGRLLATSDERPQVELWDVAGRRRLWSHTVDGDRWVQIAFSADGSRIALAHRAEPLQFLSAADGAEFARLDSPLGDVDDIAFSPGGRWLAVVAYDGIGIYDLASSKLLPATLAEGRQIAWADADTLLITAQDTVYIAGADAAGLHIEHSYGLGWTFSDILFQLRPDGRPLVAHSNMSYDLQGDVVFVRTPDDGATLGHLRFPGEHLGGMALLPGGELLTVQYNFREESSLLRIWRLPAQP